MLVEFKFDDTYPNHSLVRKFKKSRLGRSFLYQLGKFSEKGIIQSLKILFFAEGILMAFVLIRHEQG